MPLVSRGCPQHGTQGGDRYHLSLGRFIEGGEKKKYVGAKD
jgi:hypothetical protein